MAKYYMVLIQLTICFIQNTQNPQLFDGPHNITRLEGETNVYIPCPFAGTSIPIWKVNGRHYEAFSLPNNMLPVSFGLLITFVTVDMNGYTFQCIVPTGRGFQVDVSTIGTLRIERSHFSGTNASDVSALRISRFTLDHQRMIFKYNFKTLSWKHFASCNAYRVSTERCDGVQVAEWDRNIIQGTTLIVASSKLTDYCNRSVYFELSAVTEDGTLCQELLPDIVVQKLDVTVELRVPLSGDCISIDSSVTPNVVLPSKSGGDDCLCPIIFTTINTYTLSSCSCGSDTNFMDSFFAFGRSVNSQPVYDMCFYNLTREMNSTIIHFYKLYRTCTDCNDISFIRPSRSYFMSFRLLIVLPDPPIVSVNQSVGDIFISSSHAEEIQINYYQVKITDVTRMLVFNKSFIYNSFNNIISVGDLFQHLTCSPYLLTVQAHNMFGFSKITKTISNNGTIGDNCDCIAQNVGVYLSVMTDNISDNNMILRAQIICSDIIYKSDVLLSVIMQQNTVLINNSTVFCSQRRQLSYNYSLSMKCDQSYGVFVYWRTNLDSLQCQLTQVQNRTANCSLSDRPNTALLISVIVLLCIFFASLMILFIFFFVNRLRKT